MEALDVRSLIRMGSTGLITANFTQIRQALIERYRQTYGIDIDLSTGSADGIFVNDLALIINNILEVISQLYNNLDIDQASGIYLDNLCKLSNVYRKEGNYSWTWLTVTNNGDSDMTDVTNLIFVDKSGIEWTCPDTVTLPADPNVQKALRVICNEPGPIDAPVGWIDRTLELLPLTVEQRVKAKLGEYQESDDSLRFRRSRYSSSNSNTVLEGLMSALLGTAGIEDVNIYNNNTATATTAEDGSTIDAHSVYIVLKKDPNIVLNDSAVGNIIHNKLTPGIKTCEFTGADTGAIAASVDKVYSYEDAVYGVTIEENAQNVYWKQAGSVAPDLTITIYPKATFLGMTEIETVAKNLMNKFNSMHVGTVMTILDVTYAMLNADPRYTGVSTYNQIGADISGGWPYNPKDRYYDYNDFVCGSDEEGTWDGTTGHGTDGDSNEIWVFKLIHS